MVKLKYFNKNIKIFLLVFSISYIFFASIANGGTIDPNNVGNYKAQVQNTSLGSNTTINFGKFTADPSKNITISDTALNGFAWGEGVGWIILNCEDSITGCSADNDNFKVANDGYGNLSGLAWGENAGWINFGPFSNNDISTVKISEGLFKGTLGDIGYAWSENFGWIKFDCSSVSSCVETDWNTSGGVSGNRSSDTTLSEDTIDVCLNISGLQANIPNGYTYDSFGNCISGQVIEKIDICPNINGIQEELSEGTSINDRGYCVIDTCVTDPGSCVPSLDACAIDPGSCVPEPDLCTKYPERCVPPIIENPFIANDQLNTSNLIKRYVNNFIKSVPGVEKTVNNTVEFVNENENKIDILGFLGLFSFFPSNFSRMRQWLLWLFGFSRRKKWGTVYDSVTKYPLDPAYVTVIDSEGKQIAESITDLDGRYGFLLQPGSYKIFANKTNYKFPSERLAHLPVDAVYDDLYFGETINVSEKEQLILKNIPMDPVGLDWNEAEKRRTGLGKYSKNILLRKIFGVLFYVGFLISLILLTINFSLWHLAITLSYAILLFTKSYSNTGGGSILSLSTKKPVAYAMITFFASIDNRRVMKKITSPEGKFYALLPNGSYYLTVETKNIDDSYKLVYTSKAFNVSKGFVKENILI